ARFGCPELSRAGRVRRALLDLDALGAERIDMSLAGIRCRLVGFDLRQRRHLAAKVLSELRELLLQVAMLLAAAAGEQREALAERNRQAVHFFAAPLRAAWAALRCTAISSSSR